MAALIGDSYKIQSYFRDKSEFYKSKFKDKLTPESISISKSKTESKSKSDSSVLQGNNNDDSVDPF